MRALTGALIGASILTFGLGNVSGILVERSSALDQEQRAWSEVLVIHNGTLTANPSALSPQELADSQIIRRGPVVIGYQCQSGGGSRVGNTIGELWGDCREVQTLEHAQQVLASR